MALCDGNIKLLVVSCWRISINLRNYILGPSIHPVTITALFFGLVEVQKMVDEGPFYSCDGIKLGCQRRCKEKKRSAIEMIPHLLTTECSINIVFFL